MTQLLNVARVTQLLGQIYRADPVHEDVVAIVMSREYQEEVERADELIKLYGDTEQASDRYWVNVFDALFTGRYFDAHRLLRHLELSVKTARPAAALCVALGALRAENWCQKCPHDNSEFSYELPATIGQLLCRYAAMNIGHVADDEIVGNFSAELATYLGPKTAHSEFHRRIPALCKELSSLACVAPEASRIIEEVAGRLREKYKCFKPLQQVKGYAALMSKSPKLYELVGLNN